MSEQVREQTDDDQIPERHEQRSLYGEQALSHDYESLTDAQLQDKLKQFIDFLNDVTTLKHHKSMVRDMLDYVIFEIEWRKSRGVTA